MAAPCGGRHLPRLLLDAFGYHPSEIPHAREIPRFREVVRRPDPHKDEAARRPDPHKDEEEAEPWPMNLLEREGETSGKRRQRCVTGGGGGGEEIMRVRSNAEFLS